MTSEKPAKPICGANRNGGRGICQSVILYPNGRCKKHGGPSPAGIASKSFKHGMYSSVLPHRLRVSYDEIGAQDPGDLVDLSSELSLFVMRLRDVAGNLETREASDRMFEIAEKYRELLAAQRRADPAALAVALADLGALINKAVADWMIWKDIDRVTGRIQSLGKYEIDRRIKAEELISSKQAAGMFTELVLLVRQHVKDPEALRKIQAGLEDLVEVTR